MKTKSGFEYEIDPEVFDNMELVDALDEADGGNHLALSRVCLLILGSDKKKELYDHVRTESGKVPIEAVTNEIVEIISGFKEGKNS